ncbi:MAG: acyl carrier protein [Phaeodactylibacter sp.]|nr:acyl carrier protein [Phaeodactylibacter sp.]
MNTIKGKVREFLVEELNLPISQEELKDDTPLLSSRLIDSISALLLVEFLEKEYGIEFKPHEVSHDNLDSLDLIAAFVEGKNGGHA